jgi:hypothetical protein
LRTIAGRVLSHGACSHFRQDQFSGLDSNPLSDTAEVKTVPAQAVGEALA